MLPRCICKTTGFAPWCSRCHEYHAFEIEDSPRHRHRSIGRNGGLMVATTTLQPTAESDLEFYRRKQTSIAIRHVSGDRVVAMIELISPGNKSSRKDCDEE